MTGLVLVHLVAGALYIRWLEMGGELPKSEKSEENYAEIFKGGNALKAPHQVYSGT